LGDLKAAAEFRGGDSAGTKKIFIIIFPRKLKVPTFDLWLQQNEKKIYPNCYFDNSDIFHYYFYEFKRK